MHIIENKNYSEKTCIEALIFFKVRVLAEFKNKEK